MHKNPFSPSFSVRPERFYGRAVELGLMRDALDNPDSARRYLFVTGTRGCGKTSLLHQYALMAKKAKWDVLETTYQDALESLRTYAGIDSSSSKNVSLAPAVSVAGVSASLFEATRERATEPKVHLAEPLVRRLAKKRHANGLFVAIDEVQKIAKADMEEICHAVQAAKTAGHSIAFVIAGLPSAFARIRAFKGCTFIQRTERCRLGLLDVGETHGFLASMFALVPELSVSVDLQNELGQFSAGHPYLLQLLGSALYDVAAEVGALHGAQVIEVDADAIREAERRAVTTYQQNVLRSILADVRNGTREYLRALCDECDEQSIASTSAVAKRLGRTLQECSPARARVIDLQLAHPAGHGKLQLAIPYLALAFEEPGSDDAPDPRETWAPRKLPFQKASNEA